MASSPAVPAPVVAQSVSYGWLTGYTSGLCLVGKTHVSSM